MLNVLDIEISGVHFYFSINAQNALQLNGAISHLQTEMGFVEDFRYSLYN